MRMYTIGKYQLPSSMKPNMNRLYMEWDWYVLCERDDKALLLSRYVIDWDNFYEIREWLNGKCFNDGFSKVEKEKILTNETGDHLFLLTAEEARKYLQNKDQRIGEMYYYDSIIGEKTISCYPISWWLSTAGMNETMMQATNADGSIDTEGLPDDYEDNYCRQYIDEDGNIDKWGIPEYYDEIGIRPAMWIRLKG